MLKVHAGTAAASAAVTGHALDRRERVFYSGDRPVAAGRPQRIPAGFRISAINERFRKPSTLGNFGDVTAEIESCRKSVAVAEKRGFRRVDSCSVFVGSFGGAHRQTHG